MRTKIKICGITKGEEAECLNKENVDYAGFVIFSKSKRYVTVEEAVRLRAKLDKRIQKVAVTVTPETALVTEIQDTGFDILQVHGELSKEAYDICKLPIWYAVNIEDPKEAKEKIATAERQFGDKITGYVVDGAEYGSGKTFRWQSQRQLQEETGIQAENIEKIITDAGKLFILAGGLNAQNVSEGISLFSPDVVDVSTGVETEKQGVRKKDADKIKEFIRKVRDNE